MPSARGAAPAHPTAPVLLLVIAAALLVTGCGSSQSASSSTTSYASTTTTTAAPATDAAAPAPAPAGNLPRTVVMIEENHSADQIVGQPALPAFNAMASKGTLLAQYFAVTHPSLPNYIALTSGGTQGIHSDCGRCAVNADNLGAQLQKAGISWRVYAQGLPHACDESPTAGDYAKKHVPFLYYRSVVGDAKACANVVPFTRFATDAAAGRLPTVAFVIPDLAHDMHGVGEGVDDTGLKLERTADAFAGQVQQVLTGSPAWKQDTRLVITWDEGGGGQKGPTSCCDGLATGGHIPTLVYGPRVPVGRDNTPYDHYSLLKSIELRYHLPLLGHAADPGTRSIPSVTG